MVLKWTTSPHINLCMHKTDPAPIWSWELELRLWKFTPRRWTWTMTNTIGPTQQWVCVRWFTLGYRASNFAWWRTTPLGLLWAVNCIPQSTHLHLCRTNPVTTLILGTYNKLSVITWMKTRYLGYKTLVYREPYNPLTHNFLTEVLKGLSTHTSLGPSGELLPLPQHKHLTSHETCPLSSQHASVSMGCVISLNTAGSSEELPPLSPFHTNTTGPLQVVPLFPYRNALDPYGALSSTLLTQTN